MQKLVPQLPTLNNLLDILIARYFGIDHLTVHQSLPLLSNYQLSSRALSCSYKYFLHTPGDKYSQSTLIEFESMAALNPNFFILFESFFLFFNSSCSIDKSYLVDVVTKLYIATDSNPVDVRTYELCSDLVDVSTDR